MAHVTCGSTDLAVAEKPDFLGLDLSNSPHVLHGVASFVLIFSGLRRLINAPARARLCRHPRERPRMLAVAIPPGLQASVFHSAPQSPASPAASTPSSRHSSADALYGPRPATSHHDHARGAGTLIGPAIGAGVFC